MASWAYDEWQPTLDGFHASSERHDQVEVHALVGVEPIAIATRGVGTYMGAPGRLEELRTISLEGCRAKMPWHP